MNNYKGYENMKMNVPQFTNTMVNKKNMKTSKNIKITKVKIILPLTVTMNTACQNGGITFGGTMKSGFISPSFLYHQ